MMQFSTLDDFIRSKVVAPDALLAWREELKKHSPQTRIATLNGSFDLMHAGHLYILYEAAQQADILLVALNSDSSIQKYKNPSRPIIPLKQRLELMASIQFVNYVTWFDEINPCQFLQIAQPHVHVNGAEYGQQCIEADTVKNLGAKLHLVDRIDGLSTSLVIKKIQQLCD